MENAHCRKYSRNETIKDPLHDMMRAPRLSRPVGLHARARAF